jgi:translation initiation factor 2B subunit (eIF-2B alpha/beta/delta family)
MPSPLDRTSGSTDVARALLDDLERWVGADRSSSAPALRTSLLAWLRDAQREQPTMALVHQLAARALEIADAGVAREDTPPELREALARSVAAERDDLAAQQRGAARRAARLLTERESWIATLSSSGAVRDALLAAQGSGAMPRVLLGESRPKREARGLATALAAAEIPVWFVVDALLPLLVSGARQVWIGADAVTDRGVINKIGSYGLALAAREHSVPVYAIATRRKFLPATTAALRIAEQPPEEVWKDAPSGVVPRNVYFELVPLELLTGIVVEDAVLGLTEARTTALERELPAELAGR